MLKLHDFVAKQQAMFLKKTKANLLPRTVVVLGDFTENYSFVIQDAVQGYHWTNSQATIHPFVAYYKSYTDVPKIEHINFVVISDTLTYDTAAVYLFQKHLIEFLCEQNILVSKVMYFSDKAASQYKNKKNFLNSVNHNDDFEMPAEWHFFCHFTWKRTL